MLKSTAQRFFFDAGVFSVVGGDFGALSVCAASFGVIANHLTLIQLLENPRSILRRGLFYILLILNHLTVTGFFRNGGGIDALNVCAASFGVIANHLTLIQLLENPRSILRRGLFYILLILNHLTVTGFFRNGGGVVFGASLCRGEISSAPEAFSLVRRKVFLIISCTFRKKSYICSPVLRDH